MAHSAIHFALGAAVATAAAAPSLRAAFQGRRSLARSVGGWLLLSWAAGLYAIVPGLLHYAGLPDRICNGWWMNVFLFHSALRHVRAGDIIGAMVLAAFFAAQYAVLLAAIWIVQRRKASKSLAENPRSLSS